MNAREALSAEESDAVIRELRAAVPALEKTMDSAQLIRVNRLDEQPVYPGIPFFQVTLTVSHRPVRHVCARPPSGLLRIGDPTSLVELNRQIGLQFDSPDLVAQYLKTWFYLVGPRTDRIIESEDQLEWTKAATEDAELQTIAEQAATLVHPLRITAADSDRFRVAATIMRQQTLQSRILEVLTDGTVREVSSTDLLTRVPVPFVLR